MCEGSLAEIERERGSSNQAPRALLSQGLTPLESLLSSVCTTMLLHTLSPLSIYQSGIALFLLFVFVALQCPMLTQYLRKRVSVVTADGRNLIGVLHSADQVLNLVLTSCVERVLAPHDATLPAPLEETAVGVLLVRGADVVSVAAVDVYEEANVNPADWEGRDMPPVVAAPRSVQSSVV